MKKLILLTFGVMFLMFPVQAIGFRYLSIPFCVPASLQVISFQLQFDETEPFEIPAATSCGNIGGPTYIQCGIDEAILCFDMAQRPDGPFYVKAMARSISGHSPYGSVIQDNKIMPVSLKGMQIK
jgi:hypothetical protein